MSPTAKDANHPKRGRDVHESSDGEASDREGSVHQHKRFRMQDETAVQPPIPNDDPITSRLGPPAHVPQPSASIAYQPIAAPVHPDVNMADIASTLQILANAAAANVHPDSTLSWPLPGSHLAPQVSSVAGGGSVHEPFGYNEQHEPESTILPTADGGLSELQRQLTTAWAHKQVKELIRQGKWLQSTSYSCALT